MMMISGDNKFMGLLWVAAAAAVLAIPAAAAQEDYCALSPQHTMCRYTSSGPGPACGPLIDTGMSSKERDMVLDYHNRSDKFQSVSPPTI